MYVLMVWRCTPFHSGAMFLLESLIGWQVAVRMGEKVRWRQVCHHLAYTPIRAKAPRPLVIQTLLPGTCHATFHCDSRSYRQNVRCHTDIKVLAYRKPLASSVWGLEVVPTPCTPCKRHYGDEKVTS